MWASNEKPRSKTGDWTPDAVMRYFLMKFNLEVSEKQKDAVRDAFWHAFAEKYTIGHPLYKVLNFGPTRLSMQKAGQQDATRWTRIARPIITRRFAPTPHNPHTGIATIQMSQTYGKDGTLTFSYTAYDDLLNERIFLFGESFTQEKVSTLDKGKAAVEDLGDSVNEGIGSVFKKGKAALKSKTQKQSIPEADPPPYDGPGIPKAGGKPENGGREPLPAYDPGKGSSSGRRAKSQPKPPVEKGPRA